MSADEIKTMIDSAQNTSVVLLRGLQCAL